MRVAVRNIHHAPMPMLVRRGLGDLASDCSAGNADACKQYYATVYPNLPAVVAARQAAQASQPPALPANIPPGCPVVRGSGSTAVCSLNGQLSNCTDIRECDPMTGAVHFEYALPFPTGNVDILEVGPSGKVVGYQGAPQGSPATTQPIATGTVVEQGGIPTYQYPAAAPVTSAPAGATTSGSGVTQTDVHGTQQTGPGGTGAGTGAGAQAGSSPQIQTTGFTLPAFLTNTTIGSIPNWVLIAAVLGGLYFMAKK